MDVNEWYVNQVLDILVAGKRAVTLGELKTETHLNRGYSTTLLRMQEIGIISIAWDGASFFDTALISLSLELADNRGVMLEVVVYHIPLGQIINYVKNKSRRLEILKGMQ